MKRIAVIVLLAAVVASFASAGEVVYVLGELVIERGGQRGGERVPAEIGTEVRPGDLLRTGSASTAIVEIDARTTVKMRENTVLNIDTVGADTTVDLRRGGLFAQVSRQLSGRFSVKARAARMGRNPRTGEAIHIAASNVPGFKAGKGLKDAVN